ncbi:hypothetical protein PGTUg99_012934 [Puccinia graminis f. sp. tritici]|uniref:Core-binding (CB) domain-containing protein n=2 Tax=Puccinia graminis f. sp. tritici TaxID=56615 RepID=A0A5B0SBR4_PUCGR|nr:hypothetical protein PGTUg99_012934 [Puccinia graminis f. sp. tritici]
MLSNSTNVINFHKIGPFLRNGTIERPPTKADIHILSAWKSSTLTGYTSAVAKFIRFQNNAGISSFRLPITETMLEEFCIWAGRNGVSSNAGKISSPSLRKYMAGLKAWHVYHNTTFPTGNKTRVELILKASSREDEAVTKRPPKTPIMFWHLSHLWVNLTDGDDFDKALLDMILVAFWGLHHGAGGGWWRSGQPHAGPTLPIQPPGQLRRHAMSAELAYLPHWTGWPGHTQPTQPGSHRPANGGGWVGSRHASPMMTNDHIVCSPPTFLTAAATIKIWSGRKKNSPMEPTKRSSTPNAGQQLTAAPTQSSTPDAGQQLIVTPKRSSTPDAGQQLTAAPKQSSTPESDNGHCVVSTSAEQLLLVAAEQPAERRAARKSSTNKAFPPQQLRRSRRIFNQENGLGSMSVPADYLSLKDLKNVARAGAASGSK